MRSFDIVLIRVLGSMLLGIAGVACSDDSDDESSAQLQTALESAVDGRIVPSMVGFAAEASAFQNAVQALCSAPDEPRLVAVQDGWLSLMERWNAASVYVFGPLDDDLITPAYIFIESMRQRGTDYTSTVRSTRDAAVSGADPLDDTFFDGLSFNRVGLLALEILSFEAGTATPTVDRADVLAEFEAQPRKCEYFEGVTELLVDRAQTVAQGWTAPSTGDAAFRDLMVENRLPDGQNALATVLIGAIDYLEFVRRRKLLAILDAQVATAARPDQTPFYSNLEAGIAEIESLLRGTTPDGSFLEIMRSRGFSADVAMIEDQLTAVGAALSGQNRFDATNAFFNLETSFRQEIPLGLGVELGLNFSDGD